MKKKIIKYLFTIFFTFGILIIIAFLNNCKDSYLEKYGTEFNTTRINLGLKEVKENWKPRFLANFKCDSSEIRVDSTKWSKFKRIASFKNLNSVILYEKNDTSFYKGKSIWLNSNLLFWNNEIKSETDYYSKKISQFEFEYLYITYHFKDENKNKNYYEIIYSRYNIMKCGKPNHFDRKEHSLKGKPFIGNITKKQADSIIQKWNK